MTIVSSPLTRAIGEMLVFPIIKALYYPDGAEVHKLIGTGFFIESRRFLSARHVFDGSRGSAFDLEGASKFALYCIHSVNKNRRFVARYIDVQSILMRADTDIASGIVEMNQLGNVNPTVQASEVSDTGYFNRFSIEPVPVGTAVYTIAYPLTTVTLTEPGQVSIYARSDVFSGRVTKHYPVRRDIAMLNWPCYETDMELKGAASGGPVLISGSSGVVFAVNCASMESPNVSHISSLAPLVP